MTQERLIFVYNADSGLVNTLFDIGHKILSPSTYDCKLCALTHSTFRMRPQWRAFVDRLDSPVEFLHRDEFHSRYPSVQITPPAILRLMGETPKMWIDATEINHCRSLDELATLIGQRMTAFGQ